MSISLPALSKTLRTTLQSRFPLSEEEQILQNKCVLLESLCSRIGRLFLRLTSNAHSLTNIKKEKDDCLAKLLEPLYQEIFEDLKRSFAIHWNNTTYNRANFEQFKNDFNRAIFTLQQKWTILFYLRQSFPIAVRKLIEQHNPQLDLSHPNCNLDDCLFLEQRPNETRTIRLQGKTLSMELPWHVCHFQNLPTQPLATTTHIATLIATAVLNVDTLCMKVRTQMQQLPPEVKTAAF